MRKLLLCTLMLGILVASLATSTAYACHKEAELISTGDGDMVIETGEHIVWRMLIYLVNYWGGTDWTNIVVTDNLGAELEIDSIDYYTKGTVSYYTTGKSAKVHLTWNVGTLAPEEEAILRFTVSTDLNPHGVQEYTSPGWYQLNSGPTMKYFVEGVKYSEEMPSIWIEVLPQT